MSIISDSSLEYPQEKIKKLEEAGNTNDCKEFRIKKILKSGIMSSNHEHEVQFNFEGILIRPNIIITGVIMCLNISMFITIESGFILDLVT